MHQWAWLARQQVIAWSNADLLSIAISLIEEKVFDNVVSKMRTILSRCQSVKWQGISIVLWDPYIRFSPGLFIYDCLQYFHEFTSSHMGDFSQWSELISLLMLAVYISHQMANVWVNFGNLKPLLLTKIT